MVEKTERFVDIPGYEGHYQVSNLGNVRSIKTTPFLVLEPMTATNGYSMACLWKDGKQKKMLIHRLVANAFLDNPDELDEINHIDEDKRNNCVDNLEWCTHLYNMNYGDIKRKIGNGHRGKKLSDEQKAKISADSSQRRWVHDDVTERFVTIAEIDSYYDAGWEKGRKKRRTLA